MKLGIISDVHNNVIALNEVLQEFEKRDCDIIILAGDMIGIGPYPEETVTAIKNLKTKLYAVQGNHEHYLTVGMKQEKMSKDEYDYHLWEHSKLSDESKMFIRNIPNHLDITLNGYKIHISHYGYKNNKLKPLSRKPSKDDLNIMFENIDSDIIIFGHDHASSYTQSKTIFINPGSLGCPSKLKNIARAGVLELSDSINYEELQIHYDVNKVINDIFDYDYPASKEILQIFFNVNN